MTVPGGVDMNEPGQSSSSRPLSFVERSNLSPIFFAFASLLIIFVLYQVGGGLLTLVVVGVKTFTRENVGMVRLLTVVGQVGLILLPTLLFARLLTTTPRDVFPLRVPTLKEISLAFIALLALQRLFEAYMIVQNEFLLPPYIKDLLEPIKKLFDEVLKTLVGADSVPELLVVIVVVAIIPAIVEEALFRGLIQATFERAMPPIAAALVGGVIFGLFHLNLPEAVPLMGLGFFLGVLRYRSRSMLMPMGIHLLNNLLAVLALYFHVDDDQLMATRGLGLPSVTMVLIQTLLFGFVFVYALTAYLKATRSVDQSVYISQP
ncbi:MAG: CPBP family intramembrane glutamic endopeptidase [Bacteroidota bacterium]